MTPQEARIIADFLVPQIEQEVQTTARVLAAVPEDKKDYTPESRCETKCMTAGELVRHIAETDIWFLEGIIKGEFSQEPPVSSGSVSQIAADYPKRMNELLAQVKQLSPDQLAKGVQFFTWNLPNATYLQFLQKHSVHHRGQLSAYLRPMGAKVPSIYGGSADEPFTAAAAEAN
jgi:uncharacterized damage-inducible protein DinB